MNQWTYLGALTAGVFVTAWAVMASFGAPVDNTVGGLLVGILTGGAVVGGAMKKDGPQNYEAGDE